MRSERPRLRSVNCPKPPAGPCSRPLTFATTTAWRLKEMLRWVRQATSVRAAQWRITHFTRHALKCIAPDTKTLAPVLKSLMTLEEHAAHLDPKPLDLQPFQRPPGEA
ncbi:hypothetical protein DFAR_3590003 [Desulfarculales bacterium]